MQAAIIISTTSTEQRIRWRFGNHTRDIIELLYREGPLIGPEIADKLEEDPHLVREYLRRLKNRGFLHKTEDGIWNLTEFARMNIKHIIYDSTKSNTKATLKQQLGNTKATLSRKPNFLRMAKGVIASLPNAEVVVDVDIGSRILSWFLERYYTTGENAFFFTDQDSPYELAQLIGIDPSDLRAGILGLSKLGVMKLYPSARRPRKVYVKPWVLRRLKR